MRNPKKKCISKNCETCNLCKERSVEIVENGKPTGIMEMRKVCLIEYLERGQHYLMGALDGLQEASNQSRNASFEAVDAVNNFGNGVISVLNEISKSTKKLLEGK